jgi:hypothetical protein
VSAQFAPTATPQGIRVLDDDAGRLFELAHAFPGGVGVGDVVVAEFLALQLREGGERARHRPQIAVERRLLMRVFAVAQVHHLDEVAVALRRRTAPASRRPASRTDSC